MLGPLKGRTTTFLVEGRGANRRFAKLLTDSLDGAGMSCTVLDLDAFYSSSADLLFGGSRPRSAEFTLRIPPPGADIEAEFTSLFEANQDVVAIDSLNTLYHLISAEDGSSKGRKIKFALASLSHFANANAKAVIISMYRREGFGRLGKGRSISRLSDITASVDARGQELEIRTERGSAWKGGTFFSPDP